MLTLNEFHLAGEILWMFITQKAVMHLSDEERIRFKTDDKEKKLKGDEKATKNWWYYTNPENDVL